MKPIYEVDENGTKIYRNEKGQYHRVDGPAVEKSNGDKAWCLNGEFHREDGPAIEWGCGHKSWYLNGKRHRVDGPAIEWGCGDKSWYLNGYYYSESDWEREVEKLNGVKIAEILGA